MLQNECLVAENGVEKAENKPPKVSRKWGSKMVVTRVIEEVAAAEMIIRGKEKMKLDGHLEKEGASIAFV